MEVQNKQIWKKVGKHAVDFGWDSFNPLYRDKLNDYIVSIVNQPSNPTRIGMWKGQGNTIGNSKYKSDGDVYFFTKGQDVVISTLDGEFVTILKDGINNTRYKKARQIEMEAK